MGKRDLILVRGGGDLASGVIHRLYRCGYRVLVLETERPLAIRRQVSFAEAISTGLQTVEGVTAECVTSLNQCEKIWEADRVAIMVDPQAESAGHLQPLALVDAILAKRNCGTHMNMAEITIGLGPGFTAGKDVHAVIETARGHDLGRVLFTGQARANTGIPGTVEGYSRERVLYAPRSGLLSVVKDIGSRVEKGDTLATIGTTPIAAPFTGIVRGMIRDQSQVREKLKIADIDPRLNEQDNCFTISDKARCISGGVLETLLGLSQSRRKF